MMTYEDAITARTEAMMDACTRCGKCVEVCPITDAAHVDATPADVIGGVIEIIRNGGEGPAASKVWAESCVLSGACVSACDDGANPRFLLAMARVAIARHTLEPAERRRQGVADFRKVHRDVTAISRMQLDDRTLERLGQKSDSRAADDTTPPDFVFYTGCNVLKTPHIALLALDVMDALDVTYKVMGGPTNCCGVVQMRPGDLEVSGAMSNNTLTHLASAKTGQVLSWCPSCHVQYTETTLPAYERMHGSKPFEMTPFLRFMETRLDDLRPLLAKPVKARIALHRHPGVPGVMEAAAKVLEAVPGIEIVDLGVDAVGLHAASLRAMPDLRKSLQLQELEAGKAAGIDALVAVYHSDHRELCAHERDWPFRIVNMLELVGESMGLAHEDQFKRLKMMQDADLILAECTDLMAANGIKPEVARLSVQAMLAEQPVAVAAR